MQIWAKPPATFDGNEISERQTLGFIANNHTSKLSKCNKSQFYLNLNNNNNNSSHVVAGALAGPGPNKIYTFSFCNNVV
jgi:hypothetical protein